MRVSGLLALVAALSLSLSACMRSGLAPGKTGEQAASVNMQLSIEYMKLGKLGSSR
ncbi:MAG: hypothetical protein QOG17_2665, partial [Gammaproteobacteria bacterium]|nr:hypothetical protein [Gammaproteobacteria bacterium]